jgi:SlyX protein
MQTDAVRDPPDLEPQDAEQRLIDIESRLAFQERALLEVSDALAASRAEVARLTDLLRRAMHDLGQLRTALNADASDETPPPHW